MKVKLLVEGGKMSPGPAVAQQLGPMGINLGKVISDVNEATKEFSGTKVPVELDVDPKTKNYEIQVFSPPVSELIKKELKIEKASGEANKMKAGNISIERLISVAKMKQGDLLAKDLKSSLRLVIGTCQSLGVLIDSKEPIEIQAEIESGKFDKEIKEGKTTTDPEKQKEMDRYFKELSTQQAKVKKAEDEAKAAEEAKKQAAATSGSTAKAAPAPKKK